MSLSPELLQIIDRRAKSQSHRDLLVARVKEHNAIAKMQDGSLQPISKAQMACIQSAITDLQHNIDQLVLFQEHAMGVLSEKVSINQQKKREETLKEVWEFNLSTVRSLKDSGFRVTRPSPTRIHISNPTTMSKTVFLPISNPDSTTFLKFPWTEIQITPGSFTSLSVGLWSSTLPPPTEDTTVIGSLPRTMGIAHPQGKLQVEGEAVCPALFAPKGVLGIGIQRETLRYGSDGHGCSEVDLGSIEKVWSMFIERASGTAIPKSGSPWYVALSVTLKPEVSTEIQLNRGDYPFKLL